MKKKFFPKGRQTDQDLVQQIQALLGADAAQADLLIENLHRVQDHYHQLDKDLIAALAQAMNLSQAQVYEVATFYAHFPIGEERSRQKACTSLTCSLFGVKEGYGVPCVGSCADAPVSFSSDDPINLPDYIRYEEYTYAPLSEPDEVLQKLDEAGLRGLGGAGFSVAQKWRFLLNASNNRVLVVNADEGEPGTFKDRHCLETNPHKVLEGMLIAAHVIEADDIYIYLRDEYKTVRKILETELPKIKTGKTIHLRRGAGAYICGEETALLESLEGKRGLPRIKPPYPAQSGLFGRPTLVNNVETLWRVQEIMADGIEAGSKRFYSLSGRVQNPGVYEASVDITVAELIEMAGGMLEGHKFKAYLPGGASGGILPASKSNLPLSFGALEEHGCFIGSAAVIILSDQDNMKDVVINLMNFFDHESCGQCTPCRVGCEKIAMMLKTGPLDYDLVTELSAVMQDSSICGLGQAAPNPVLTALAHFAEDFA
ncbi:NADH-ubiquinone oxidoreductase-F iron-sulfur binding region domain-containing protein [Terasakiella sp. A23]|uniref:NADH-ubiquinone oxidoreductase-F iron-sulfur binding region domain-containing protein n=1 Tax=Terasakiella sp. FCG-A23 TaxID=3080561 RepID=UPI002954504F|nr:NADH-ubiquinone oxidoreductase-F iron-sulfur binding region domain-containing protein [Terasakiella sp. A23]MDV7338446.1 NADH-ubiquinone oxidoreductase-F iron-sulfur binding region domain-containing protein [Terasakiella sp. A23]